jgi:hypothetical protein
VAAVRGLRAAAAALLLLAVRAGADSSLGMRYSHYDGSDGVTVVSPQSDFNADMDDRTAVALHYGVDAVSAASFNYAKSKTHLADPARMVGNCKTCHNPVDAISGASLNYRDTRQELGVTFIRHLGETDFKPSYIRSQEDDYTSQTLALGLSQNLFSRDSNLALDYRHSDNQSQPVWNPAQVEELGTDTATLTLTQVLTRRSELRLDGELSDLRGFLSNPYSFVQVGNLTTQPLAETEPDERRQMVLGGVFKQSLGWDSAVELDYRYYSDDWDVTAHTVQGQIGKQLGGFTLEAAWRHYTQSQAWFFRNFYQQGQAYMSRDLKLAAFSDNLFSLGLRGGLGEDWDMDLSYSRYLRQDALDYRLYFSNGPVVSDLISIGFTYH